MTRTNFKKLQNESYYFTTESKNYFIKNVILDDDTKIDFDVNYSFYKLQNNALTINGVSKHIFKTKKEYLKICYQVNLLNTLQELKKYNNITIFKDFKNYTYNGLGKYKIKIYANDEKHNRILNVTCLIATLRACLNMSAIMQNGSLIGDDMDDVYIQNMLQKYNIKALK